MTGAAGAWMTAAGRPVEDLTDEAFNQELGRVVRAVVEVASDRPDPFFTTVELVYAGAVTVHLLVPKDGDDAGADPYDVLFQFGKRLAREQPTPLAAFVSGEADAPAGRFCVSIAGATPDGRMNTASVTFGPGEDARPAVVTSVQPYDPSTDFVGRHAGDVFLRGFRAGVAEGGMPWWRRLRWRLRRF